MNRMIAAHLLGLFVAVAAVGCTSPNNIDKVTIHDVSPATGRTRMMTCRTCREHSDCGNPDKGLAWVGDHYKKTGHADFDRDNCDPTK